MKQRENLQSSCQHIEGEDQFGEPGKESEISVRANQLQTRTDIVECRNYGCEVRDQVKVIEGDQEKRSCKDQHVYNEENIGRTDYFVRDGFAIHFYFLYCIRVKEKMQFFSHGLT